MWKVYVGFGEFPEQGEETRCYAFATEVEVIAFKRGLEIGVTWESLHVFDEARRWSYRRGWCTPLEYIRTELTP